MDKAMRRALEADGEKLRQLTGEDHGPHFIRDERDIVDILRFWEGRDDVPEDLSPYLSCAADEIAGLREENKYLSRIIDDASPKF